MLLGLRQALRNTLFNMGSTRTQDNRPRPLPPLTSTVRICVSSLDLDVPTWVLVPSESGTVADVVQVLSEKLHLPRHASSYLLFLRGAVLLSSESASLIRDGDEITIRKKPAVGEKRSRAFLELPHDTPTDQPVVSKPLANHHDEVPLDGTSMDATKTAKLEKLREIATSPRLRKCPRTSEDASEHSRTLPAGNYIVEKEKATQQQVAASVQGDIEIQEVPLTSSQAVAKVAEVAEEPVQRKKATEESGIEDPTSLDTPQAKFVEGAEPLKARGLASLSPPRALSKVSDLEGELAAGPDQRGVPSLRSVPVPDLSPTNSSRLSHEPSSGFLTAGPPKVQNQHALRVHHRDVSSMRTLDLALSSVPPLRSKPAVQSPTFKERKTSGGPVSSAHQKDKPSLNETQSADLLVSNVSELAREPVKTKGTKVPSLRSELTPSSSFNNSPHLGNTSTSPRHTNMLMAHSEPTAKSPKVNAPKLRSELMPEPKHIVSATPRSEVTPNSPPAPIDSAPQANASGRSKLSSGPVGSNVLRLRSEPAPVASQRTSAASAPRNDIESVSAAQTPNATRSPVDNISVRERSSGSAPLISLTKKISTHREQSAAEREKKDTLNADRTEVPPSQKSPKDTEMNKTPFQRASGLKMTKARRWTASGAPASTAPIALDQEPANPKAGPKDPMVVKIKVPSTASSATESKKVQPSESVGRTRQRFPSAFRVTKARRRTAFSTPPAAPETPPKYSDTDPELASKSASQQMPKILSNSAHASDSTKGLVVDSLSLRKTPQIAESHLSSLSVQPRESLEPVLPLTGKDAPRSPGTSGHAKDKGVGSNLKPTATPVSSSALQTDENPEVTYSNPSEKATTASSVTPGSDLDFAKDTLLQKLREVEESGMFTFESEAPPSTSAGTERNDGSDDVKAQVTGQTCFEFVSSVPENDTRQVEGEINFNFNMAQARDDSSSESKPVQHLEPTEENQGATQAAATALNLKQKERENEVSVRNLLSSMEDPGPKKSSSLVCDIPEDGSTEGRARRRPFQLTPPRRPSLEPPPKNSAKQDVRPVDAGFGIDSQNIERGPFQPTAPRHLVPPNSPSKKAETKDSCSPNTGAGSDSKIAEIPNASSAPRASEVMLDATIGEGSSPSHRMPSREKQADSRNEISTPRLTEKESRYIEEENYNESYIVGRKEIERANRTNNFTQPPPRQKYMKSLGSETRAGDTAKFIPQSAHSRPFRGNSAEEIQASGSAKSSRISPERSLPKNAVFAKPMGTPETSSTLKSQAKNQSPSMLETFMKMLETTSSFDKDYEVFCQVQVLLDIDSSLERPSRWVPCLFHRRPEDKEHLRIIGITPETLSALKLTGDLTKQTLRNGKIVSGAALTAYFPLIIDVRVLHNFDFTAFHGDRKRLLRLSDGIRQGIRDLSSSAVRSKEQENSVEQPSHSSNKAKSSELRNITGESELGSAQSPSAVNAADMDTETAKQSGEAVTENVKSPPGAMDAIAPMLDDLQNMQGVPDFGKDDGEPFLLPSLEAVDSVLETTTPITEDGMQYAESAGPARKNNSHSQADGIQSSELKLGGDYGTNVVGPVENESDSQRHKQKPAKVKCITQVRTGSTFDAAANTLSRIEKCGAEADDSASKPSPDIVLLSPLESPKQTANEPEPFVPNINQIEPLPAKSTSTISSRKKLEDIDYSDFTSCMIQILSEASKSLHNLVDKEQMLLSRIVERR